MTLSADRVEGPPAPDLSPGTAIHTWCSQTHPWPGFRGRHGQRVAEALAAEGL